MLRMKSRGAGRPQTRSAMISRTAFFFATIVFFCALPAEAQKAPYKWGDVPPEQLSMTAYPPDTSAAAVILFDYGEVYHSHSGELVMDRHRRIKILDEGAFDLGTVHLSYRAEKRSSGIRRVRGQTYNIDDSGKITRA